MFAEHACKEWNGYNDVRGKQLKFHGCMQNYRGIPPRNSVLLSYKKLIIRSFEDYRYILSVETWLAYHLKRCTRTKTIPAPLSLKHQFVSMLWMPLSCHWQWMVFKDHFKSGQVWKPPNSGQHLWQARSRMLLLRRSTSGTDSLTSPSCLRSLGITQRWWWAHWHASVV